MIVFAVDDDRKALDQMTAVVEKLLPEAELLSFEDGLAALAKARTVEVDVAFLDIRMPELGGLDLGQYLRELNPFVNLIYVTEHQEYGFEALAMHASGYVMKPADESALRREVEDLRYPEENKKHKRVFAQTFGNFELFVDGKPVNFKYSKTKEIVAILINNRGAQTTNGELIADLWEDDGDPIKKQSYLSNLRQDLQNTLNRLKLNGIILKQRGSMAINVDKIDCDLFDWLEKGQDSAYHYLGDYMNQYSWPEYRHAELDEISYAMYDD